MHVDLNKLVALFYSPPSLLASFEHVQADAMPPRDRRLLAHDHHMTVTVEEFHGDRVDVTVHRIEQTDEFYAREITLSRQRDGQVVQYGIVRLRPDRLDPLVWREIHGGQKPLGTVLIAHHVHRQVSLDRLWKVTPTAALAARLQCFEGMVTYGRTARLLIDSQPIIELLEIVSPPLAH
jgi:chorismate-pyruvate lyase